MAIRKTITVSITREQDAFVCGRLGSGRFGSVSEAAPTLPSARHEAKQSMADHA